MSIIIADAVFSSIFIALVAIVIIIVSTIVIGSSFNLILLILNLIIFIIIAANLALRFLDNPMRDVTMTTIAVATTVTIMMVKTATEMLE